MLGRDMLVFFLAFMSWFWLSGVARGWSWVGIGIVASVPLFVCPTGVLGYDYGSWVARGVWDTVYCLVDLISDELRG